MGEQVYASVTDFHAGTSSSSTGDDQMSSSESSNELSPRHRIAVLVVLCLALMMVVSAVASLNVALPDLARGTGASQSQLQWIIDAYALVFAGLLLPAGAFGDRYGRKGILLAGLVVFGGASAVAMVVSSASTLIGLRAVIGVGAAMVMPTTLSIITNVFPEEERGRAVGIWAGVAGAGAMVGLLLSGLLLEWFSWPSVFGINVTLALVALLLTIPIVPSSKSRRRVALDPAGALLSSLGLFGLVFAIIEAPIRGWTDPLTLTAFAVGLLLLVAFVLFELWRRGADARPPPVCPAWLRGRLALADAAVLRPVRAALRRAAVPAVRARLLAARGRAEATAVRRRRRDGRSGRGITGHRAC
jgi:MFS family permease